MSFQILEQSKKKNGGCNNQAPNYGIGRLGISRPNRGLDKPFINPFKDKKNSENDGDYEMRNGGSSGNDPEKILGEFILIFVP